MRMRGVRRQVNKWRHTARLIQGVCVCGEISSLVICIYLPLPLRFLSLYLKLSTAQTSEINKPKRNKTDIAKEINVSLI